MGKLGVALLTPLVLLGCASTPESVAPAAVPADRYLKLDCKALVLEEQRVNISSKKLAASLDHAAWRDHALTWAALIFPPTLFFIRGAREDEEAYAQLLGEARALDEIRSLGNCPPLPAGKEP